jgi:flagellar protein FliS
MNSKCAANIKALKLYNTVGIQTGIEEASPHRLIQMLLDGALGRIASAKSHIYQNEIEAKGVNIGMAISIIGGLRDSLDHKAGGDIAANLDNLYEYMTYRLTEANIRNSHEMLDEVSGLLVEIKSAWDGIAGHELTARANETTPLMQNTG